MIRGEARRLALGAVSLLALGLFVAARLQVTTDITHFLPAEQEDADVDLARQLMSSDLSRTMILLVDAADTEGAVRASRALEAALRAELRVGPALAFLDGGPPAGAEEALSQLYQPRHFAFLAADPADVPALLTDDALREAVERLKRRLSLPISTLVSRIAPEDPLLILPALLERVVGTRGEGFDVVNGRFITPDGRGAVLFLGTHAAPFDSTAQRPILEGVQAAFEAVNAEAGGGLVLTRSGANRFSVRAEDGMRADINRVSTLSFVAIGLLFVVLFRSLRLVLVTVPILLAGFLAGTAACLAVFGSVHGLTLGFGSALIGVSVDYTIHFYCHHLLAPHPGGPRRTLSAIWPGLLLGAATTVLGFIALVVSTFPGLRELALFGVFGIAATLAATYLLLPGLVPAAPRPTRACAALASGISAVVATLGRRRGLVGLLMLAVVALGAIGLPRVRWHDGVVGMNRLDPDLVDEDAAILERVGRFEQRRFVVAVGQDEQRALEVNDRVAEVLAEACDVGELGGFRSVASLLPSAARQRAVDAAVRSDKTLWPRLEQQLGEAGFVPAAFAPFHAALDAPPPEPLVWEDLLASPLSPLVKPFRVALGNGAGALSFVSGVRDAEALERRLTTVPGARLIDIEAVLTRAYGAYRSRMTSILLVGLLAVIGLVALRHRAVRPMLAACVPALLSVVGTVALIALLGFELNLLSLVALLMVVSMGIDYGIFLTEPGENRGALEAAHVSVFVAGVTTVLGFGLLAFSSQPVLFALGLTTGIGMTLCLVFAMTFVVFFREIPR